MSDSVQSNAVKVYEQPGRVAGIPVEINSAVQVDFSNDRILTMKSGQKVLSMVVHPSVQVTLEDTKLSLLPIVGAEHARAQAGTARALANNMMIGLTRGFEKKLSLVGVGYKAKLQGQSLVLSLGYSHDIHFDLPEGIQADVPSQTEILIKGVDKQAVGQVAAKIRAFRPPSPYKGKGVRYHDEVVKLKEVNK